MQTANPQLVDLAFIALFLCVVNKAIAKVQFHFFLTILLHKPLFIYKLLQLCIKLQRFLYVLYVCHFASRRYVMHLKSKQSVVSLTTLWSLTSTGRLILRGLTAH